MNACMRLVGLLEILETFSDTALLLPLHRNPGFVNRLKLTWRSSSRFPLNPLITTNWSLHAAVHLSVIQVGCRRSSCTRQPVLVLRAAERPEALAGTAKLIGTNTDDILTRFLVF